MNTIENNEAYTNDWLEDDSVALAAQEAEYLKQYEAELAKAPESMRSTLRAECEGDATTVYAFLNDCLITRNAVLQYLLVELHGEAQGMQDIDWSED